MIKKKLFINNNNMARFVCPKCQDRILMNVSKYKETDKAVVIEHECKCGLYSTLLLERRQFCRKDICIPGTYTLRGNRRCMVIRNLSRAGLKFERELKKGDIKIGDKLIAEFCLNNVMIKKKVIVRSVLGNEIGTEFCFRDIESPSDQAITHYLLQSSYAEPSDLISDS